MDPMPKRPHVLLINPWVHDFKLYDEWMHPLGLYCVADLFARNGWRISFINCLEPERVRRFATASFTGREISKPPLYNAIPRSYKEYGISERSFLHRLRAMDPVDLVAVGSSMTYWIGGLKRTVTLTATHLPKTPVVVGGQCAFLLENCLRRTFALFPNVSVVAQRTASLSQIGPFPLPVRAELPDLCGWHAEMTGAIRFNHAPILSSIGCPLRCSYCASRTLVGPFIRRNIAQVLDEIRFFYHEYGVCNFSLYDDAFLYPSDGDALRLLRGIGALNLPLRVHVPNGLHLAWVTPAIADALQAAGCMTLRFGYESGDAAYERDTCKKAGENILTTGIDRLKQAGFPGKRIGIYCMGGLPGQLPSDMERECHYIAARGVQVKPVFLSPVPHTPLFEHYAARDPLLRQDPLSHNDLFYVTRLPGWDWEAMEAIRNLCRQQNTEIAG